MTEPVRESECPLHADDRAVGYRVLRCWHRDAILVVLLATPDGAGFAECQVEVQPGGMTLIATCCHAPDGDPEHERAYAAYVAIARDGGLPMDDDPLIQDVVEWAARHGIPTVQTPTRFPAAS